MAEQYYLQDKRTYVGNSMMWWRHGGAGYCCDVREAGVFTKEEAFAQHRMRETDIPWPKAYIDQHLAHHVDMQRVDLEQARRIYSELETGRGELADAIENNNLKDIEIERLRAAQAGQCEAITTPRHYAEPHRCPFEAKVGERFCGTHLRATVNR